MYYVKTILIEEDFFHIQMFHGPRNVYLSLSGDTKGFRTDKKARDFLKRYIKRYEKCGKKVQASVIYKEE